MKNIFTCLFAVIFLSLQPSSAATAVAGQHNAPTCFAVERGKAPAKKKARAWKKGLKKKWGQFKRKTRLAALDAETLLMLFFTLLFPPLAMALYDGFSKRFWLSLVLTLLGYLPGLIYTAIIVFGGK